MVHPLLHVGESEAPQESEILPRWGKMSVPAKAQTSLNRCGYKSLENFNSRRSHDTSKKG